MLKIIGVMTAIAVVAGGCGGAEQRSAAAGRHTDVRVAGASSRCRRSTGRSRSPASPPTSKSCRDQWGVPHIYAKNADDLFFRAGLRRRAGSPVAHGDEPAGGAGHGSPRSSGPPACRTIGWCGCSASADRSTTRSGRPITLMRAAFSRPTCAASTRSSPTAGDNLPVEFTLTGITPEPWKAEEILVPRPRHGGDRQRTQRAAPGAGGGEVRRRARPTAARGPIPTATFACRTGLDVSIITDEVIRALDGHPVRGLSAAEPAARVPDAGRARASPWLRARRSARPAATTGRSAAP